MRTRAAVTARGNIVPACTALLSSAVPVLREQLHPAHAAICGLAHGLSTLTSVHDATVAVAIKSVLAVLAVIGFVLRIKYMQSKRFVHVLAELPLLRTALFAAMIIGIGLTAFDCCTAFHGASVDAAGTCHCWLTGMLASAGAAVMLLLMTCGRAIRACVIEALRAFVALFVWIFHASSAPTAQLRRLDYCFAVNLFDLRYLHGKRGPPTLLALT